MSGFTMSVEFTALDWAVLDAKQKAAWQRLVDETCEVVPKHRTDAQYDHDQASAEGWGNQTTQRQSGNDKI